MLKPPKASRLEMHVGYWLLCASSQVSHALSRELSDMGITLSEWLVLRELFDGDRRPSAVAAKFGLTRGALSRIAERLVSNLLVTQVSIGEDRRGRMLALTEQGRAMVPILAAIADANDEEFFGSLDEVTRGRFVAVLRRIIRRRG